MQGPGYGGPPPQQQQPHGGYAPNAGGGGPYQQPPPQQHYQQHQPPGGHGSPNQGYGAQQQQQAYSGPQQQAYGQPQPYGSPPRQQQPQQQWASPPPPAPFMPPPQQQQHYQPPQQQAQQQFGMPAGAAGLMQGLTTPLGLATATSLLSAPQQYVTARVGWLKSNMTGGAMSALFSISTSYVTSKLLMLLAPFLSRWTYTRQLEQIAGGQKYRPPSADVNAPDLYLPLMAAWTYVLLGAAAAAAGGRFRPEMLSNLVYGTALAWGVHWLAARLLLRGMNVPGVGWSELLAYTGYAFVPACVSAALGAVAGRGAYWAAWAYGSTAAAVFLVKTMKRVIFQETRQYGGSDLKATSYLLLALALFQYPYAAWLGLPPKALPPKA